MSDQFDHEGADWRIEAISFTTEPVTIPGIDFELPAGTPLRASGFCEIDGHQLNFGYPSPTALFLNMSESFYQAATETLTDQHFELSKTTKVSLDDQAAFGYFEQMFASVVFAYTALEAFANSYIPEDFSFTVRKKRCDEVYGLEQIERFLSLDVKLGDVLPQVFEVATPRGTSVWEPYIKLQRLRDRIIHLKSEERIFVDKEDETIWSALLKKPVPRLAPTAKNMIGYFLESQDPIPRWYQKYPHGAT